MEARQRQIPQAMLPRIKVLLRVKRFPEGAGLAVLAEPAVLWEEELTVLASCAWSVPSMEVEELCGFILSSRKITGISTREPMILLVALNVNGPTASPPSLCATKAIPQMAAVSRRISEFFNGICCFFIIKYPLVKLLFGEIKFQLVHSISRS